MAFPGWSTLFVIVYTAPVRGVSSSSEDENQVEDLEDLPFLLLFFLSCLLVVVEESLGPATEEDPFNPLKERKEEHIVVKEIGEPNKMISSLFLV